MIAKRIKEIYLRFKKINCQCPKILTVSHKVLFRFFRPRIIKLTKSLKAYVLQKALQMQSVILNFWYKHKSKIILLCVLVLLSITSFWVYRNRALVAALYNKIQSYLIFQNESSDSVVSFSNLFTAIGTAVLGVLAIAFSLSLFALQQAADKYTPNVLSIFLKDKTNLSIFWSIAFVAVAFFVMAILPLSDYLFLELTVGFILLFIVFFLLRKQYFHIVKFINPNYQIILQHNDAIKSLDRIDKWLNLMIKTGVIRHGDSNENK